jgi:hypothetical protein
VSSDESILVGQQKEDVGVLVMKEVALGTVLAGFVRVSLVVFFVDVVVFFLVVVLAVLAIALVAAPELLDKFALAVEVSIEGFLR